MGMNKCTLTIPDYVNVKFTGLDPVVRRKIVEKMQFMVPYARHLDTFKLGRWDGKVSFATVGGSTYYNVLDRVLPIVMDAGYDIDIVDQRQSYDLTFPTIDENFIAHKVWPEGHERAGTSIVLRDYQVEAINNYFENPQSIQCISTGAGKTILSACLSMSCEKLGRTMVIVPSKALVEQTEEDYINLGLDVGVFFGDRKEWGHTHTIATWQSLGVFCKKKDDFKNLDASFDKFVDGMKCVILDEAHGKGKILKDLLSGPLAHLPVRWGMTGTIQREEIDFLPLLIGIGPVVGTIRAKDLQDKGVLANVDIEILQLRDDVQFKTFDDEYAFINSDKDRLNWIANFCKNLEGNTLVLVERIECGQYITDAIPDSVFISGEVKLKDRKKEYKEVTDYTAKIIVATAGTAAVGLNVPSINNLVMVGARKAFVSTIQAIGRILRKTSQKDRAKVYDITSTCKFSAKHLTERKKYYREAEYPHSVKKITYR